MKIFNWLYNRYGIKGKADTPFIYCVILLAVIGVVTMFSASYTSAAMHKGSPFYYLKRQAIFVVIGIVLMFFVSFIDFRIFNSIYAVGLYAVGLLGLILCFVFGTGGGSQDTSRWLDLGPITIQPSEVAKATLVIILAYCICIMRDQLRINKKTDRVFDYTNDGITPFEKRFYSHIKTSKGAMLVLLLPVMVYCGVVLAQKHISATVVLLVISFAVISLSGADKWYFLITAAIAIAAIGVVIIKPELIENLPGFGYSRIEAWLNKDSSNRYQTWNGLYAIASGGLFGVGFTESKQKQLFVPEPQNDFVFSIAIEENGFLFALFVMCLFAVLIYRGYKIAIGCSDLFGSLIVMGFITQVAVQTIFNIAVITDTIPNTGMSLPFFSYGGSSVTMLFIEMGMVLSVSRASKLEK